MINLAVGTATDRKTMYRTGASDRLQRRKTNEQFDSDAK